MNSGSKQSEKMTRTVCYIDKNGQYWTCVRNDDVPCEKCGYNRKVSKVYRKIITSCDDCPNYSFIPEENGSCAAMKEWIDGVLKLTYSHD